MSITYWHLEMGWNAVFLRVRRVKGGGERGKGGGREMGGNTVFLWGVVYG